MSAAEIFPLRDFVNEELEERGWSREHFAELTGYSPDEINAVLDGKQEPSVEWPLALALAFNTSEAFWRTLRGQSLGHEVLGEREAPRWPTPPRP